MPLQREGITKHFYWNNICSRRTLLKPCRDEKCAGKKRLAGVSPPKSMSMRLSNKAATIIFSATALVLLIISYLLYLQFKSLLYAQESVNESHVVKLKLEQALSSMKDAETAQRGFLLTQDSLYLEPFAGCHDRTMDLLSEIRAFTKDNEDQERDLNSLETLAEVRFRAFDHVIRQYNNPDINAATKNMHLKRAKEGMDSMRTLVLRIAEQEEAIAAGREVEKRKYHVLTPLFAVLLMMLAIGILVFSYGKIIEQLNRSRKLLFRLKHLNNKLKEKNHKLELYNKELDSFTYIASHDLKEPLRKIFTYITLIESSEAPALSDKGRAHFGRIKSSAQRMQSLLDDLLHYAHINMEQARFEEIDLNQVVADVKDQLREEIRESGMEIRAEPLPVVRGLPFQIRQLFENLISNSIKYRQERAQPQVSIAASLVSKSEIREKFHKESSRYYKLLFRDNGLGFRQGYAEKVFQLFQRLHQKNEQPGTGIGLTICKKIVDNHNGFIKAVSEVNQGTTFVVYLPAY